MEYTLKQIKDWKKYERVTDISNLNCEQIKELREKEEYFNEVGYSHGIYGVNGCILQGHKSLNFYIITRRSVALFCIM